MPPVLAAKPAAPAPTPARRPAAPAPAPAKSRGGLQTAAQSGEVAPGVLELKGLSEFTPPAPIADFLDARKMSTVNVRFGNLAQGPLEVRTLSKGKYRATKQPVPLQHPAFSRVAEYLPALIPALIISDLDGKLLGEVGLAAGEKIAPLADNIRKTPEMLGLLGFTIPTLPTPINKLEGGSLHLGLTGVPLKLGSAFSGTFSFEIVDDKVTFEGSAAVDVKGLANGNLDLKRAADGAITGKVAVALTLPKNFSGAIDVAWDGVAITGTGKVGYKGEKFSGEVTLYLMEKNQAQQLAESKKAPEGAAPKPEAAAPGKKPASIDYVVFGEGDLASPFTEWLTGTAHVIADPKGNVTVIGKITPQKEFILFEQKDYVKQLFKVEARASYGLPVVGNVFIFANASMDLFAKLGPAKFYNIVIDGTYSTDPKVAQNFSIRGSLNISAAAGARLRAEAGVGLEILSHDIKAGAGINGIAGVKAYAEATPIIGYREQAAEGQDKKGEWFVRGELEVAAQPFLGLSGDLFVELETPWWSPLSDKKWTWPLFGKEWPLGGTMGMLVSVDYVFGSGQWPKFDFKPVEFNSEKFMTDMYNDKAQSGGGKEAEQKGKWGEKNSKAADPPAKASPKGNAAPGKAATPAPAKSKPVSGKKSGKPADPNAKTKEGKSVKQLQDEAAKKGKKPDGKDVKGAKGDSTKKDKPDPNAVKTSALDEFINKAQNKPLETTDEVRNLMNQVAQTYKPKGLKSIWTRVPDESSMGVEVMASASEANKRTIKWTDLFKKAKAADRAKFKTQPRNETNAAMSVNGKMFGEVVKSDKEHHAEQNLVGSYWEDALNVARTNADKGQKTTIAIVINRAPCHNICSPLLVKIIREARSDPKIRNNVQFILAPTGVYEPTNNLTEEELKKAKEKYDASALKFGSALYEVQSKAVMTDDTTRMSDLEDLVKAGWDLYKLKAKPKSTAAGDLLAEAAHKLAVKVGKLKV